MILTLKLNECILHHHIFHGPGPSKDSNSNENKIHSPLPQSLKMVNIVTNRVARHGKVYWKCKFLIPLFDVIATICTFLPRGIVLVMPALINGLTLYLLLCPLSILLSRDQDDRFGG